MINNFKINKITQHLISKFRRISDIYSKQIDCPHLFKKFGMGYECKLCGFYTGTNSELNKYIQRKLRKKK